MRGPVRRRAATAGTLALIVAAAAPAAAEDAHKLSLQDAVRTAIASDADLYIAREDERVAAEGILLARAVFTTKLFGELYAAREDRPPSVVSFPEVDKRIAGSVGISGRVQTGLTYKVSAGLLRESHDDPFSTVYSPGTTTTVRGELIQPLLRGAFAAARRPIRVASLRRDRTQQELRARIERAIGEVEVAYWNFVRARSEHDARSSALQLAKEQVEESKRLTKLGTGSDLDVVEAEVGVSRRQQDLLRTQQDIVDAENKLFATLGVRAGDPAWSTGTLEPSDAVEIEAVVPDLEAQLALARAHRADVLAARGLTVAESAELEVADDLRRPALDLVAVAGTTGFAGQLASDYATAGVNGGGLVPPYTTDTAYDGGAGKSLANTLGKDLDIYVGLRFEMPLGDHEAEVKYGIQKRAVARARLAERQTLARIESEVRAAVASLAVDAQLVAGADQTVQMTQKLVDGMRKRFRVGASTSFDVLRVSEELTRAQVEAARARADYRVSLTRLAAATGTLLDSRGIKIDSLGAAPQ